MISETMETKDHLTVDRQGNRNGGGRPQRQGEGRPARQGEGNGRPMRGRMAVRSRVVREDQDRAETEDRTTEVKDALAEITVADREPAAEEEIMMPYSHQN